VCVCGPFNTHSPEKPGLASSPLLVIQRVLNKFLQARCPFCRPTNSVKTLKNDSVSVPECGQLAATMLSRQASNSLVAVRFAGRMPFLSPKQQCQSTWETYIRRNCSDQSSYCVKQKPRSKTNWSTFHINKFHEFLTSDLNVIYEELLVDVNKTQPALHSDNGQGFQQTWHPWCNSILHRIMTVYV